MSIGQFESKVNVKDIWILIFCSPIFVGRELINETKTFYSG
jgi:hypothetical protein